MVTVGLRGNPNSTNHTTKYRCEFVNLNCKITQRDIIKPFYRVRITRNADRCTSYDGIPFVLPSHSGNLSRRMNIQPCGF